ncbi:MAG: hypothetical protein C0594_17910 [Marinilabiliales bacterium]|nr:MAG: hypothetical protein C0594_17910 [Marinilabiliales bacterium]
MKEGWRYFISKPIFIGLSFILLIITIFPQLLAWYLQIGKWFVYSYQDEGFNFLEPNFVNILFSYRKGLFVYTPITLLGIAGLIIMLLKKRYYEFFTWLAFFLFLTYILSSWWCWYYGGSYGLRAYVDFYCVLFIPFAVLLNFSNKPVRLLVIAASCFFIVLTTIQIYQYKEFILQWSGMDKERYWKVFLKTDDTYKGLFWKKIFDKETLELKDSSASANFIIPKNENKAVVSMYSSNIKNFNSVSLVEMICENEFEEKPMPKIEFIVKDSVSNETLYKNNKPLYHFKNSKTRNKGFYFYEIPRADNNPVLIYVKAFTSEKELVLKNVKLNFYSKK